MSKLYVVGIGPGSREYLTLKALEAVKSVDVLVGSTRALELFPEAQAEGIELGAHNVQEVLTRAIREAASGRNTAVLSTGDPGFSGTLKPILKLRDDLGVEVEIEVVPGVSSVQMCSAKLLIPWDDADIVTMHGKGNSGNVLKLLDNGKPTIILPNLGVKELADFLMDSGVEPGRRIAVCEKMSYPDERVVETSLCDVCGMEFGYMCVVVVY
ncbi:precorrin-6y C5,15-methyltransferase (decarboxylating) subunit CbiE [Methanobacterium aggregans]|uniref:precorrin-6y C5,15-methyltransferase (decarboxylating) subunit CbiE n=1 Tax=Methanobacterium aggregans TaxID=1615586 RepID=UPI001AEB7C95|nr:precorrin-6y C5,15-methyltransferase (decarboxylating) subunit CbiE [Methanobacterium aggregans]MBP2046080.1 cobalt-precorrin-7 (C5)-methyltransferase [Methanobacterium aggregans]